MEYIRGVSSAGVIRTLQDRALVEIIARGEGLGRPLLYGTTQRFLEHFGFRSLDNLPRPEKLPVILSERAPLEDIGPLVTTGSSGEDQDLPEPGVAEVLAQPEGTTFGSESNYQTPVPEEVEEVENIENTDGV